MVNKLACKKILWSNIKFTVCMGLLERPSLLRHASRYKRKSVYKICLRTKDSASVTVQRHVT